MYLMINWITHSSLIDVFHIVKQFQVLNVDIKEIFFVLYDNVAVTFPMSQSAR